MLQMKNYDSMLYGDVHSYKDHRKRIPKVFIQSI